MTDNQRHLIRGELAKVSSAAIAFCFQRIALPEYTIEMAMAEIEKILEVKQ